MNHSEDNHFASIAEKAYSYESEDNSSGKVERIKFANFNLKKRKEFWGWWFSEAVPQAWELVEN